MQPNALYYGDCLDWMEQWDDQSVDLIYLDPPFNSKATYNQLYHKDGGGDAQFRAFSDTWVWDEAAEDRWIRYKNAPGLKAHDAICGLHQILGKCGMLAYLTYMAERLEQMHRLLKDTGSIYLHCDPTASHYLKVVMDAIYVKHTGGGLFKMRLCGVIHQVGKALSTDFIENRIPYCFTVNHLFLYSIALFVI